MEKCLLPISLPSKKLCYGEAYDGDNCPKPKSHELIIVRIETCFTFCNAIEGKQTSNLARRVGFLITKSHRLPVFAIAWKKIHLIVSGKFTFIGEISTTGIYAGSLSELTRSMVVVRMVKTKPKQKKRNI